MSEDKLQERVHELEERVAHLERELGVTIDRWRFERKISRLSPKRSYEMEDTEFGGYRARVEIAPGDLPHIANRISDMDDIGWQVVEPGEESMVISVEEGLVNR